MYRSIDLITFMLQWYQIWSHLKAFPLLSIFFKKIYKSQNNFYWFWTKHLKILRKYYLTSAGKGRRRCIQKLAVGQQPLCKSERVQRKTVRGHSRALRERWPHVSRQKR